MQIRLLVEAGLGDQALPLVNLMQVDRAVGGVRSRTDLERDMRPLTIAVSVARPPEPPLPEMVEELADTEPEPLDEIEVECEVD